MQPAYLVLPFDAASMQLTDANRAAALAADFARADPGTRWLVCRVVEERTAPGPADDFGVIAVDDHVEAPRTGFAPREDDTVLAALAVMGDAGTGETVRIDLLPPETGPAARDLAASTGSGPTESTQDGLPQRCAPHAHDWTRLDYANRFACEHCGEQIKRSELPDRTQPPSVDNLPLRLLPIAAHGGCASPPEGWWCSRPAGHEGPCAARPTGLAVAPDLGGVL